MHLSSRTVAYDTRDLPKRSHGRVCYLLLSRASNVLELVARFYLFFVVVVVKLGS